VRNPNLRDDPCERCGWKFKGFHICVENPSTVIHTKGVAHIVRGPMSEEQKEKIGEAQRRRWARLRMMQEVD
jgi:hypothetical protein